MSARARHSPHARHFVTVVFMFMGPSHFLRLCEIKIFDGILPYLQKKRKWEPLDLIYL